MREARRQTRRGIEREAPEAWRQTRRRNEPRRVETAQVVTRGLLKAAGGGRPGDGAENDADAEPFGVALEAAQEAAAPGGGDGGVAFAGESGGAGLFVGEIGASGGELRLAGAAILDEIVERLEVGGGNCGGSGRGVPC